MDTGSAVENRHVADARRVRVSSAPAARYSTSLANPRRLRPAAQAQQEAERAELDAKPQRAA